MISLASPFTDDKIRALNVGDEVELSGVVYTGRDAVHKFLHDQGTLPPEVDLRDRDEIYQRGEEQGVGLQTNQDAYATIVGDKIESDMRALDEGFEFEPMCRSLCAFLCFLWLFWKSDLQFEFPICLLAPAA